MAPGQSFESEAAPFDGHAWIGYRTYVRLVRDSPNGLEPYRVRGPEDIYRAFRSLSECDRERFYSVHLDSQHNVCGVEMVTQVILDASLITPREIYKAAILSNAGAVVLVHNHPSGSPDPSAEDRAVAQALTRSGEG